MFRPQIAAPLLALVLLLASPFAAGGNAGDPESTDPAGDVTVTQGIGTAADFPDVDLQKAWISEPGNDRILITVESAAAVGDDVYTWINFTLNHTSTSVSSSTANGRTVSIPTRGAKAVEAAEGLEVSAEGKQLRVLFPRAFAGASGGDAIANLTITREAARINILPAPQTARDVMPNVGAAPAREYRLDRPAIVPRVVLEVAGGTLLTGSNASFQKFTGDRVTTDDRNAHVTFNIVVRNLGSDDDNITLKLPNGSRGVLANTSFNLTPDARANTTLTIQLRDAPLGHERVSVNATSTRGGVARVDMTIVVDIPNFSTPTPSTPTPTGTTPTPTPTPTAEEKGLPSPGLFAVIGIALLAATMRRRT